MLKMQFRPFDPSTLSSDYLSIIPISEEDKSIISLAYKIFKANPSTLKIYFNIRNSIGSAFFKNPACPHSLRRITESSFIVTKNRKDPQIKLGNGVYKVARAALRIKVVAPTELEITPVAIVKDIEAQKEPFTPRFYETLSSMRYVECVEKITIATSKSMQKQFHIAEKALCDGHHFSCIQPKPNIYNYIRICRDAVLGMIELNNFGAVHGDIKPSNILVFKKIDGPFSYSAKLCDIDSILEFGKQITGQTADFLSPSHREILIREAAFRSLPLTQTFVYQVYQSDDCPPLIATKEDGIASLGLTLAYMGMLLKEYQISVSDEISALFWAIVSDLTGGFIPITKTIPKFGLDFNLQVYQLIKDGKEIPKPRISLEEAAERLSLLMTPPQPILISIPHDIPPVELVVLSTPLNSQSLYKLQTQIQRIYSIFLNSLDYQKIYFTDTDVFAKQIPKVEKADFHSIRKINPTSFAIEFDRKYKKKYLRSSSIKCNDVWLIQISETGILNASWMSLIKDILPFREYKPWPMESLKGMSHVECIDRVIHKTTFNLFKGFHITEKIFSDANLLIANQNSITTSQFMQICNSIIAGQIELHLRDFVHGNLSLNNIIIFSPTDITGPLSAKISSSSLIVPFGTTSYSSTFEFLAPRHRVNICKRIIKDFYSPPIQEIKKLYNSNIALRNIILNKEDATITTGIVLAFLLLNMPLLQKKTDPEKLAKFWTIIKNLTGDFGSPNGTETWVEYFNSTHLQTCAALGESDCPFIPKITLEEASVQISALI